MVTNLNFMLLTNFNKSSFKNIDSYLSFIESCIQGGVNCVQIREKQFNQDELLNFSLSIKILLDKYNIPLIINDDINLAKKVDAYGVWLGQQDVSPVNAREILGNDKFIGLSIESEEDLISANKQPINMVACSAVFASKTKINLKRIWGLSGLSYVSLKSKFPCLAIGGITLDNLTDVMQNGAYGIACINDLHEAKNPKETALEFSKIINKFS